MASLDQLPCAILICDGGGRTLFANAELVALTGVSAEARIGTPLDALFPPAGRIFLQTHLWPTLLREGCVQEAKMHLLGRDGERLPVLVNARRSSGLEQEQFVWTLFVVHERNRFEAELLAMRRRAEAFAATLADRTQALESANERIRLATDSGGIGIWQLDAVTGALRPDEMFRRLFGLDPGGGELPWPAWGALIHAQDRPELTARFRAARAAGHRFSGEFRAVRADGMTRTMRASAIFKQDSQGRSSGAVGAIWDVTEARQLESELAEQHELLRVTLESIGDAVITTDALACITWLNPVAERLTGWSAEEAKGLPLNRVFHILNEESRAAAPDPVLACLGSGAISGLADHTVLLARDGREFGIQDSAAPIRDAHGQLLGAVLVFHDVSEQRRISGEMTWRATHDALTGLFNRAEFELRLQRLVQANDEGGGEHALLYLDLDQFKLVNDACGHAVGDQLLQQVSRLLADSIRSRDTLARLGGDEFAVILEHCGVDQATRVAQGICDRMEAFRFIHEDRRFRVGASIGLVAIDRRWNSIAALQQAADTACYAAKEAGRNRVHVWSDTDVTLRARQFEKQWTERIEAALDSGSFELFYQRIRPLRCEERGLRAEILLRLREADGSLVLPGAFLPAAERFHLASRIDRWVLRETVAWLKALPRLQNVVCLNVNLSGQSVGDRAFHGWAIDLLDDAGVAIRSRLCLEITETAAVTNPADAALFIDAVRAAGVRVALDDFGAGASSFGYLKTLAIDVLKIDGQFIRDLVTDPLDDVAVRCFTEVAQVVGVQTVAEFVESPAVLERLKAIGVGYAQGYLIHRPESLRALERTPATRPRTSVRL